MNKTILTTVSIAVLSTAVNAQITPSQTISGGIKTTIDCFDFAITDSGPLGTPIADDGEFTTKGNLTGGTYLPDVNGYSLTSFVSNYNASGTTTASYSGGALTFTGSVGLITTADQLKLAEGLGEDCRTLDFSFNKCTAIDESSTFLAQAQKLEASGATVYYGVIGDTKSSVTFKEAFVYDEKTKAYVYDETPTRTAISKETTYTKVSLEEAASAEIVAEEQKLGFYYLDATGVTREFSDAESGTVTILKDFTVCVECTEVVPEPSSTLLMGLGAVSFLIRRKR